eukprot:2203807-Pleurochrysis_carterae.AAC.3
MAAAERMMSLARRQSCTFSSKDETVAYRLACASLTLHSRSSTIPIHVYSAPLPTVGSCLVQARARSRRAALRVAARRAGVGRPA